MEQTVRIVMRFLTFTSLTTFESCESRDNEIVTDILTTPNTLRENSHGCHGIVNTLRDSVVTIVTDRIVTVSSYVIVSRVTSFWGTQLTQLTAYSATYELID